MSLLTMDLSICFPSPFIMPCNFPVEEARKLCCSATSAVITNLLYAIFICIFAVVGATLGALAGAFVGAKTKMGCLHGAMFGAMKGGFFAVYIFKITLRFCSSDDMTTTTSLLQPINAFNATFDQGLSKDSIAEITEMRITEDNVWDSFRNRISCSICLEDFTAGEIVHSLPHCHHMYHRSCIKQWLIQHKSCPLCRRQFRL